MLREKYRELATLVLGADRAQRIERAVGALVDDPAALRTLIEELLGAAA